MQQSTMKIREEMKEIQEKLSEINQESGSSTGFSLLPLIDACI